jgi:hypothetical protein
MDDLPVPVTCTDRYCTYKRAQIQFQRFNNKAHLGARNHPPSFLWTNSIFYNRKKTKNRAGVAGALIVVTVITPSGC